MDYIIKFEDETYLTKHSATPYGNYWEDHASQWDRVEALRFKSKLKAIIVLFLTGKKGLVTTLETTLTYQVGKTYMTIGGGHFTVVEDNGACVCNEKGHHRYDRKDGGWDNGRTTGGRWTKDCLRYPPVEIKGE
jgi:hypothetical protein